MATVGAQQGRQGQLIYSNGEDEQLSQHGEGGVGNWLLALGNWLLALGPWLLVAELIICHAFKFTSLCQRPMAKGLPWSRVDGEIDS